MCLLSWLPEIVFIILYFYKIISTTIKVKKKTETLINDSNKHKITFIINKIY